MVGLLPPGALPRQHLGSRRPLKLRSEEDMADGPMARNILPKAKSKTTSTDEVTSLREAVDLRIALTERLRAESIIRTPAVEAAMRRIPRHLFLPGVPLEQAHTDSPVPTKIDGYGTLISAASQPRIVAMMLEQLDARPGHRVMEVGAGTGYNAALLAAIVGDTGRVVTIDVEEDLVVGAGEHLAAADLTNVDVMHGDGALGHPEGAPYDRIIATVGAYETPTAWLEQLAPDGRLVAPLRLRGAACRSITFERYDGGWRDQGSELAVFMPLRGIGDDARRLVSLTPEQDVILQVHKDQEVDAAALAGILETERRKIWTDVFFPPMVPHEWMDLWLACRLDNAIMPMNVEHTAVQRGAVIPMFSWGAMATTRDADFAYLTTRPTPARPGGSRLYEVGVIGHGPNGRDLAYQVSEEIRTWNATYRSRTVRFEIPDAPVEADASVGRFVLARPHHPITVTWQ
ncbi:methyltransferase, FxLD system [Micromonospora sp. NPDC023888]|uniref:methyltransferase, FxLD system n=1 Tax=Micromonospora sp. NPDC023888 TaxID=3155607 RepID=UPI0033D49E1A